MNCSFAVLFFVLALIGFCTGQSDELQIDCAGPDECRVSIILYFIIFF